MKREPVVERSQARVLELGGLLFVVEVEVERRWPARCFILWWQSKASQADLLGTLGAGTHTGFDWRGVLLC